MTLEPDPPGALIRERKETENFKRWNYEQLAEREGFNLDIWADVEDKSLVDVENLPAPDVIAEEIVEHLNSALAQFDAVASELRADEAE